MSWLHFYSTLRTLEGDRVCVWTHNTGLPRLEGQCHLNRRFPLNFRCPYNNNNNNNRSLCTSSSEVWNSAASRPVIQVRRLFQHAPGPCERGWRVLTHWFIKSSLLLNPSSGWNNALYLSHFISPTRYSQSETQGGGGAERGYPPRPAPRNNSTRT